MKTLLTATLLLAFVATAHAESPFAGVWKQNRAKTQYDANGGVLKIEADGSGIRYSSPGLPVYGGPLDGSERPGLGSMAADTFKLTKRGDRGYEAVLSRNGKAVNREVVEVSPDGKTLTTSSPPSRLERMESSRPPCSPIAGRAAREGRIRLSAPGSRTAISPSGERSRSR